MRGGRERKGGKEGVRGERERGGREREGVGEGGRHFFMPYTALVGFRCTYIGCC